jgi:hypothetical protein
MISLPSPLLFLDIFLLHKIAVVNSTVMFLKGEEFKLNEDFIVSCSFFSITASCTAKEQMKSAIFLSVAE